MEVSGLLFKQSTCVWWEFTILIFVGNGILNEQFHFHSKFFNESILYLLGGEMSDESTHANEET